MKGGSGVRPRKVAKDKTEKEQRKIIKHLSWPLYKWGTPLNGKQKHLDVTLNQGIYHVAGALPWGTKQPRHSSQPSGPQPPWDRPHTHSSPLVSSFQFRS